MCRAMCVCMRIGMGVAAEGEGQKVWNFWSCCVPKLAFDASSEAEGRDLLCENLASREGMGRLLLRSMLFCCLLEEAL